LRILSTNHIWNCIYYDMEAYPMGIFCKHIFQSPDCVSYFNT